MASKKKKPYVHSGEYLNGFKLGEKTMLNKIKKFVNSDMKKNLPFDVIQNLLDFIDKEQVG